MDAKYERNGIPKFDLAEQILAEQRKNSSVKRKGPAKKVKSEQMAPKFHPADGTVQSQNVLVGLEKVIADIVARDIERLCRKTG